MLSEASAPLKEEAKANPEADALGVAKATSMVEEVEVMIDDDVESTAEAAVEAKLPTYSENVGGCTFCGPHASQ